MHKIFVLGAGLVGRTIARDMAQRHRVTTIDIDPGPLATLETDGISVIQADLANNARVQELVSEADLVIGAVPGHMGFKLASNVITAGKPLVDISFFPEDPFRLEEEAGRQGLVFAVDAGVAPGLDHLILGHHDRSMEIDSFECLVGGLPSRPVWPFRYKAAFSPVDVLEEYERPARYVRNGELITKPALSEPALIDFEEVGTLESFNTDGLRTLLKTMRHIPNLREKTLRYEGHIELIKALKKTGFFGRTPVSVKGVEVAPRDVTSKLLFDDWALKPGDTEFTLMRVSISGLENDKPTEYRYTLYDQYDPSSGASSMARTTGYTCTAIAELLLQGHYYKPGVAPLELIGREVGCFGRVAAHLLDRNVVLKVERH